MSDLNSDYQKKNLEKGINSFFMKELGFLIDFNKEIFDEHNKYYIELRVIPDSKTNEKRNKIDKMHIEISIYCKCYGSKNKTKYSIAREELKKRNDGWYSPIWCHNCNNKYFEIKSDFSKLKCKPVHPKNIMEEPIINRKISQIPKLKLVHPKNIIKKPIINRKISQIPKLKAENVRITKKFKERAKPYNFKKRRNIYRKISNLRFPNINRIKKNQKKISEYIYEPEPTFDDLLTSTSPTISFDVHCTNCGARLIPDDEFCTNCGNRIK
jgi:hypothetical protein